MIFKTYKYKQGRNAEVENRVLYIEYIDGLPHSVTTAHLVPESTRGAYWCMDHWDFFKNGGDEQDIRYYNHGSGGCAYKDGIHAPHFIENEGTIELWKDEDVPFIGDPKNVVILEAPKGNPFDVASEESLGYVYCDECGETIDTTYEYGCVKHMYIDDEGELRYDNTKELVE